MAKKNRRIAKAKMGVAVLSDFARVRRDDETGGFVRSSSSGEGAVIFTGA
jgi:hypothetical protein